MRSKLSQTLLFSTLALIPLFHARVVEAETEKWEAPAEESAKPNPFAGAADARTAGEKVYAKRCAGCHGDTGDGDGPDAADLGIHPAKLSQMNPAEESDGALFWKIQTGKKPMPKYGAKLTPDEIWQVIVYVRSFRK
ncbi:MAG: cytochrome c [Bdellovibrionota bacterium]